MVTLPSSLSTGLTSASRELEARGAVMRQRRESCGVESTQGGGVVWGQSVPLSTWNGSGDFWTFEWKMARFGAFWALFMQTAVI